MNQGTLYGETKTRAFRCVWTLSELGMKYDQVGLNLQKGEGLAQEFRIKNPIGRIPVWEDESGVLSESLAICLWLAEKDKSKSLIFPEGSFERAKVHQWLSFAISELEQPLWNIRRHFSIYSKELQSQSILKSCQVEFKRAYLALLKSMNEGEYLISRYFYWTNTVLGKANQRA